MTVPTDLDSRFRESAVRAGLLDAGYDIVESPVGPLLVAATDRGLLGSRSTPTRAASWRGSRASRAAGAARSARRRARHRELDEYFGGRRQAFDLAVDLRGLTPFSVTVLGELARVPYGQTATYGELAARAGRPKAARAVGMVMNRNPIPVVLPCHRIVGASAASSATAAGSTEGAAPAPRGRDAVVGRKRWGSVRRIPTRRPSEMRWDALRVSEHVSRVVAPLDLYEPGQVLAVVGLFPARELRIRVVLHRLGRDVRPHGRADVAQPVHARLLQRGVAGGPERRVLEREQRVSVDEAVLRRGTRLTAPPYRRARLRLRAAGGRRASPRPPRSELRFRPGRAAASRRPTWPRARARRHPAREVLDGDVEGPGNDLDSRRCAHEVSEPSAATAAPAGPNSWPLSAMRGVPPVVAGTRSARTQESSSGAVRMNACQASSTSAAAAHGHSTLNVVTLSTGNVCNVSAVTMPKLPAPAPRRAQNRSGSLPAAQVRSFPSGVTISIASTRSHVSPCARDAKP